MSNERIDRREFLGAAALTAASLGATSRLPAPASDRPRLPARLSAPDEITDATAAELSAMMTSGQTTARVAAERFLSRINELDKKGPAINAVIELNPDALDIADRMDAERKAGRVRGPLHGVPILIKDNIDTSDKMKTSAGSLALATSTPGRDAFIVDRLRAAGAVLLGKTNLSEWANFRSTRSSSGWSARGGQTKNPHVLDRNPCGSSSGTGAAIAAGFATLGIGTETDGSIICPSSVNGIVGIKLTVGLWGRSGIVPISVSQDTAGPMCRTVADCAALLGPLTGTDPRDRATQDARGHALTDYTRALDANALKGAKIGVVRNLAGFNPDADRALDESVAAMKDAGAIIVDRLEMKGVGKFDDAELDVLLYEFKSGLNAYLNALGPSAPVKTLADAIAFNEREKAREMPYFAQEIFERAQKKGPLAEAAYTSARNKCIRMSRTEGIDALLAKGVDALVFPSNAPAWPTDYLNGDHVTGGNTTYAAVAGYPSVTVPMGFARSLPLGLSFVGAAWTEARLIGFAYAFEQRTKARRAPGFELTLK